MAITPVVNNKVELIAFRAAEAANYLRIGSRKYFKDQLVGKRNGQEYTFVVRDAGKFQEGMDLSSNGPSNLVERSVTKKLELGNILIATNLLNTVTDVDWQSTGNEIVMGIAGGIGALSDIENALKVV